MKRTITNLGSYTLAELLDDPEFMAWVMNPNEQLDAYWAMQQNNYPNLVGLIADARKLILSLKFEQQQMDKLSYESLWQQIAQQTATKQFQRPTVAIWIKSMAAAIVAIAVFGTAFYFYTNRQIEITTGYGQTKHISLPDASEIILNANSTLKYPNNWNKEETREVWLKGEAFFKVNHLHQQGKLTKGDFFLVHAGNVAIKVLGTTFNVNQRRHKVGVALMNGKISMEIADKKHQALILKPGDLMVYDNKKDSILRELGNVHAKMAWKDGLLIFEQLSAAELFQQLEDNYGYKAIFKNPAIKSKKISGTFNVNNYDDLLKGIEIALGISIKKDEDLHQLIIQ
ncbi:FecR family protein [Pedobacter sp. Hv1]|uniref:FecR family protein n=1 Tax=Pedobacter sp. Hv1 TaxID=1740090 RepID=UPI0006D8AA31|nr:FecR domain-containing protein [Pedobacter sp. Hv1]KQC00068.1 hypothetical protein AQF98_13965 [Pedobacter sp. Hv1]